jgi:glycosyltransferase involved in cell wall biosynthesis
VIRVSIVTVVKNKVDEIENTIKSVLKQNYKNLEYIVVDGFSTDGTYEKILKYKKKIKIIQSKDINSYTALNKGIKFAKGNYIGHLNGGDIYKSKNTIKYLLSKITKEVDFFFSNLTIINKKKKIQRDWIFQVDKLDKFNFYKIAHPTLFINQRIKILYSYNEKYNISADFLYLQKITSNKSLKWKYLKKNSILMESTGRSSIYKNPIKKGYQDLRILIRAFGFVIGILIYVKKISTKIPNYVKNLIIKKKI